MFRGPANRGFYLPINDSTALGEIGIPEYVSDHVYIDLNPRAVDELIYLHGSTCADEVGLVLTLAHELQHAVQYRQAHQVWAVNGLVGNLSIETIEKLKLAWSDIPVEVDARLVAKRAAEEVFGKERVFAHIEAGIARNLTEQDTADWSFVQTLDATTSVDIEQATRSLFARLGDHRSELEGLLKMGSCWPGYSDISLDSFFTSEKAAEAN
jgi:hypothetical protein